MPVPEINQLNNCLNDLGFQNDEIAEILYCCSTQNYLEMIRKLRKRRQTILNIIHLEEQKITNLDYLVFQLERETSKV